MMKSRIDQFKKVMVIMAGLLLVASSSHAQTITAIGNGIWNDVNSWDCACIPGPNNDAVIGAAFSINVSGDVTINSLTIMATALFTVYDTFRVQTNVLITGGFVSYGIVHIAGDITNNGALQGPGTYCVAGVSTNGSTGTMLGDMDFCDLTPPMTTPFVDNNSGFIQANVDFCLNGLCGTTTNNPPVNTLDTANTTTEEYTPIEICIASTDA
ncbi:MAG: hypothetical protein JKX73_00315, partial [Flavobacteriales bacterium]|nr:hypothetical protein [Flavobacteriales bacterium]